ncbi:MAG: phenylalanine--tRNA ligase subunit beta [Bacteroidales bacterium]|nr:phenylalanine--tRNA ligase subunit beta [Bacteroidales bacterium]
MKISYNWLKQYLDFDLSPEKLSELLTDCGLEVEGLEKWQSVKGGLEGIVIGEVKTCEKHPDADRLSITTVDVGRDKLLPVVCGAPNVAAGQKVVVATVGTKLYKEDDFFEIKKAKLRGEPSEGMICAEDELGLGTSHEGIMVLNQDAKTGTPASEYFGIEEDYIFEIGLTPNRTDAMAHIGVARDIKAVLDNNDFIANKTQTRQLKIPPVENFKTENHSRDIEVIVENTEACPRYAGVTITGIEVKESPDWLKNRLNAIGLRPINNIVDITNYVLHETGQPLHAFDADEITGNKVIVKKLPKDSIFITLDEIERKLTGNDLMICNATGGMCIGGVFGGVKSGVTEKTKNIFLESAWFDPVHIRKTSKHHDLQTDASFRFERGVDPEMILYALRRAALMIKEIAGGIISSEIKDVYPNPFKKININVTWKNIDRLIGKSIGKEVIKNILHSLEFEIPEQNDERLKLAVPSYRVDVTREADVIEEILRIYGYNNIEIPAQQLSSISHTIKPDAEKIQNLVSDYLSNNGFKEIINNSLTKSAYYETHKDFNEDKSVNILNPLSRDLNVMRQTLLFGGLETILYNLNRKNHDQKIYEFGKVYTLIPEKSKAQDVTEKYIEVNHLALFITGRIEKESWYTDDKPVDYNYLKALSSNLLKRIGINIAKLNSEKTKKNYLSTGMSYISDKGKLLEIGVISKSMLVELDIKQNVFYTELNRDLALELVRGNKIRYKGVPKFPEVRRDLALLLDRNVPFAEVEKLAYRVESKILKEINLFDVYEGENIEEGKKSYAVSFILQDEEKTLTDKVIDKIMNKMMKAFEDNLNATIR